MSPSYPRIKFSAFVTLQFSLFTVWEKQKQRECWVVKWDCLSEQEDHIIWISNTKLPLLCFVIVFSYNFFHPGTFLFVLGCHDNNMHPLLLLDIWNMKRHQFTCTVSWLANLCFCFCFCCLGSSYEFICL